MDSLEQFPLITFDREGQGGKRHLLDMDLAMTTSDSDDNEGIEHGKNKKRSLHMKDVVAEGKRLQDKKLKLTNESDNLAGTSDQTYTGVDGRKRLYFPKAADMEFHSKVRWAVRLSKAWPDFAVLFKEGKHRPYVTVKDNEAVKYLSTVGFEGVVLEVPDDKEKFTKIILFDYPTYLEPDDVLVDDRFAWIKRRVVRTQGKVEPKPQLIGLFKGTSPPEKVFVKCLGYKRMAVYNESPLLCNRCCRWGHMAFKCYNDYRCRYCAGRHDSKLCADKIKAKVKIIPKCTNCMGEHNANSWLCPKRPQVGHYKTTTQLPINIENVQHKNRDNISNDIITVNVWKKREELRRAASFQGSRVGSNTTRDVCVGGSRPNVCASTMVIEQLRTEVEELKLAVQNIQKSIANLCAQSKVVVAENEMPAVKGSEMSSKQRAGTSEDLIPLGRVQCGNAYVHDVIGVLESVVNYVNDPSEELKNCVLLSAKHIKEKIIDIW